MKNKLLPLLFLVGSFGAYSQIGIGTKIPNTSSALDVYGSDKGLLIPRVSLTGTTDATTIANGNVESLLVYNKATVSDITPGYYYWFNAKWNRITIAGEQVPGLNGLEGGPGIPGINGVTPANGTTTWIDSNTGIIYVKDGENWVPVAAKDGVAGAAGLAGGPGAPGDIGMTIPAGATIWIDTRDGSMYAKDAAGNWTKITSAGTDGLPGIDGKRGEDGTITTLDAIQKDAEGNIYAYVGDKRTTEERTLEWKDPNSTAWVKINGLDGRDGKDGIIGGSGAPGADGTPTSPGDNVVIYIDKTTGTIYVRDPENPTSWIPLTGQDGIDGLPGITGERGKDGVITTLDAIQKDADGNIYAYVGDKRTTEERTAQWNAKTGEWVKINGLDGSNGITGATGAPGTAGSITTLDAIIKDPQGNIYAYVGTDKTVAGRDKEWADKSPNWVKINGLNGANGIAGATGVPGADGAITTLDAIVKDANGDVYAYVGTDTTVEGRDAEWKDKSPNWVKISGLDGRDGKDGIIGGSGAPGADGTPTSPGDNVVIYIDKTTGTIYVRDPENPTSWIPLTGQDGIDGLPGITGERGKDGVITTLDAIQKDADGNIYAYVGDKRTTEERTAQWNAKTGEWVKINGLDGSNGITGATGAPGTAGSITTLDAIIKDPQGNIYAYVGTDKTVAGRDKEWADKSPNWVKINGLNGANGIAGATGVPGATGSITTLDAIVKDANGDVYAYVGTDATVEGRDAEWKAKSPNWVKISANNGKDGMTGGNGAPGADGVSIPSDATIYVDQSSNTVYILKPGSDDPTNPANWIPINGKDGLNGKDGIMGGNGAPGSATAPALDDTIQMYIDYTTGIVYVRDAENPGSWVSINGKNGIDGKNGIAGDTGLPGTKGLDGTVQMYIDYQTGTVYVRDPQDPNNWVPVKAAETLTALTQNATTGVISFTAENGIAVTANVISANADNIVKVGTDGGAFVDKAALDGAITKASLITRTSASVLTVSGTDATLTPASVDIKPSETVGDVLTTTAANTVEWKAIAKSNVMGIEIINDNYTVLATDYTIIADNLTKDITITLPDPALNKGRLLVINQFNVLSGTTPVTVNFNYELLYSRTARHSYIATSLSGGATEGSAKITLQSNGVNWYVITYTM